MIAYKVIINKSFNNMFNVFRMELNLNKTFDNMCNLFKMEVNIFVRNVRIRQLRKGSHH